MKYLFLLLFLLPLLAISQARYALIDKKMKQPILYTDSVSVEQVVQGYFPIENKNIDTLIANLIYLKEMLSVQQRAKMKSFELRASNSIIKTERVPYAYGDRYNSVASSKCGEVHAILSVIEHTSSNKQNKEKINKLLAYLKSNTSFYKEPKELTPKLYEVVVITD